MDTFFFFSGLLGTWSIYRFTKKIGDRPLIYIPMSYLGRFLRLAPMMIFVFLIWMTLLDQLPYGYKVTSRTAHHDECADIGTKYSFSMPTCPRIPFFPVWVIYGFCKLICKCSCCCHF